MRRQRFAVVGALVLWPCYISTMVEDVIERTDNPLLPAPSVATVHSKDRASHQLSQLRLLRLDFAQAGLNKSNGPLVLPPLIRITPGANAAVPLNIKANETLGDFVVFMNVPEWLHLSEGTKAATGIWFVSSSLLPRTRMTVSGGHSTRHDLTLRALLKGQRKSWQYKLTIEIAKPLPYGHPKLKRRSSPEPVISLELEAVVLQRAQAHMAAGSVVSARRLYRHLANKGSVAAAFHLAVSYDPAHLKKIGVTGLNGDQSKADHWVRRATELMMTGQFRRSTAGE